MIQAYSRLKRVLGEQKLSVPELHRRMQGRGLRINLKSLYRLNDDHVPLERLDLRVAGAICHLLSLPLSDLITFQMPQDKLRQIGPNKQKRLDVLMAKNNERRLSSAEQRELRTLVREAEETMLDNARRLAQERRKLLKT